MGHVVAAFLVLAIGAAAGPEPAAFRGVVVDEAGRPVPGAEVAADAFAAPEARRVTAADGSFALPIDERLVYRPALIARSADGGRLGVLPRGTQAGPAAPVRIVLKPGRSLAVRIEGPDHAPIADASVSVHGSFQSLAAASTGPDGVATLAIPADARVECVVALKPGRGLDYSEHGDITDAGRVQSGAAASDLPEQINLVLDGARTARIRAVDAAGKPLPGVTFGPWLINKPGRRTTLNLGQPRPLGATTDAEGVATFDYLPAAMPGTLQFWPWDRGYVHRRVLVEEGEAGPVTARMIQNETIRGRVARADGQPAAGIQLRAMGTGRGLDRGQSTVRSRADGTYEMTLPPDDAYIVYVDDLDWAAPSRLDVILRPGRPAAGVDFALSKGTILRGRVTVGPDARPVAAQTVYLQEGAGKQAPAEVLEEGNRSWREVMRQANVRTDAEGRYAIRVGPGHFRLWGPARTETFEVTVGSEPEVVHDFKMPRAEKGPLAGRVVEAATGKGVAGAKVEFVARNQRALPVALTADADGRFRTDRDLDPLTIHAHTADRALAAIVEIGADDGEVTIPIAPTASGSGLLLDEAGKPAANQKLMWGRRVYLDDESRISMTLFAPRVVTDAAGKFTLPGLVVGQGYDISVDRDGSYPSTGLVRAEEPGPFEVGTLRIGGYHPPPTAEEMSSFKGGPGVGDPAPDIQGTTLDGRPLKLADFRGKFVLLDFWATWCGPCIGEIPQLQAVHEAFGKDGRFAILSLSVDEKVDEPRAFQEKRKLPWSQGFLGEGIHSAIPGSYGVRAIPAFVLVGPDGRIAARGMRGDDIKKEVARALGARP